MDREEKREIESCTRVLLRPLASPLPLAFFAFGSGSAMQSAQQLGWIPQSETALLSIVVGAFVFPPMALAAIFAFLTRETLGATLIGLLSFSWLAQALVYYTASPSPTNNTLGVLGLIMAVVLLILAGTATLGKPILAVFVALAATRYVLNGVCDLTMVPGLETAAGILGLLIFVCTLYGGLAFGLEDVQHRTVLPGAARARRGSIRTRRAGSRRPQAALGAPALRLTNPLGPGRGRATEAGRSRGLARRKCDHGCRRTPPRRRLEPAIPQSYQPGPGRGRARVDPR